MVVLVVVVSKDDTMREYLARREDSMASRRARGRLWRSMASTAAADAAATGVVGVVVFVVVSPADITRIFAMAMGDRSRGRRLRGVVSVFVAGASLF